MSIINIDTMSMYNEEVGKNFSYEKLRELEKKDEQVLENVKRGIRKDLIDENNAKLSKEEFEDKLKEYMIKNPDKFESVQYYLNCCYPSGEVMYMYINGAITEKSKPSFEDLINKKYGWILKTYINKVDLRNYIKTIDMTKAETFYKVGENYYMNEGKKAKFKVIQPYVLSEIQKEFIRRFKEYLGVVVGDCDLKKEDAKNYILDLLACFVQSKKTESILFLVGMYGSGKSFIHKVIAALLGNMYLKTIERNDTKI